MPRLALIATGGTIAGSGSQENYTAGVLGADVLLGAVAELRQLADWHVEQPFALDSRDMEPAHWLLLADRVQAMLDDPAIDGIVITHGTDTLEESAFALDLLLPAGKPVVLTAAMRPATSLSSDGPLNLLQAACVALHPAARERGVLVVANGLIIAAQQLRKTSTHAVEALQPQAGAAPLGQVIGEIVQLPPGQPPRSAPLQVQPGELPRVDILYAHAGATPDLIAACVAAGARGLVLALSGHGSIPQSWRPALAQARASSLQVVRATRISAGGVWPNCNEDDTANGWLAAGPLSPQQARVLLILALAGQAHPDPQPLSGLFARYHA
ncbi:asparaginase [Uliginosibacterium sp. TH139]|uniref:asparaginase n=1 Tax=Uliginosibacterium sp. TH139 TaxID=2067453 RepID=UPI000C7B8CC2|nr:asparaginase [Uliginosibacterium sp. TH139]PLK50907.1 asparaginase [Uliginosibacterium sp. TH139]